MKIEANFGPGTYFLGDPCYAMTRDYYDGEWGDKHDYQEGDYSPVFAVHRTRYGDGEYYDQYGHSYPVDNRATWTEISRFSGTGNLKERLLQSFSLGNSGGNSGGSGGQTTPDVKPDTGGLSQLFDQYENGFRDRFRNNPNEGTFPDAGDDSGLFRSDRGLFQMIRNEIKIFIWSLFKWALLMIVAFWFSVNAILWGLKKLGGWLPKISVSLKRKSDTQNEE